jgi:hypothetical protein
MSADKMTIVLHRLPAPDREIWRACPLDAEQCGGCGLTPEEAIGWLILNHPGLCGVGSFAWPDRPPMRPGRDRGDGHGYPMGEQ